MSGKRDEKNPSLIRAHVNDDPVPSSFVMLELKGKDTTGTPGMLVQMPHGAALSQVLGVKNKPIMGMIFIPSENRGAMLGYTYKTNGVYGNGYYLDGVDVNVTKTLSQSVSSYKRTIFSFPESVESSMDEEARSKRHALDGMSMEPAVPAYEDNLWNVVLMEELVKNKRSSYMKHNVWNLMHSVERGVGPLPEKYVATLKGALQMEEPPSSGGLFLLRKLI